jgi:hypothetical protein
MPRDRHLLSIIQKSKKNAKSNRRLATPYLAVDAMVDSGGAMRRLNLDLILNAAYGDNHHLCREFPKECLSLSKE